MSLRDMDIADMQCWVFCMAQKKWRLDAASCARIFSRYGLFDYLRDDYDYLHLSGYECALSDLENRLERLGVDVHEAA